jgi:hypothetical protein
VQRTTETVYGQHYHRWGCRVGSFVSRLGENEHAVSWPPMIGSASTMETGSLRRTSNEVRHNGSVGGAKTCRRSQLFAAMQYRTAAEWN